ncbi:MAG: hypothetical protein Kow0062_00770 [Acidobacteriota bacterium]
MPIDPWQTLVDILALLAGGFLLGALAERLRQSAILGYLAAGMLLGPNALNAVARRGEVEILAELGVALLLFSIGLEFPWQRLRGLGRALAGGAVQIAVTLVAGAAAALSLGLTWRAAAVAGAMLALSSTAYVLRLLARRTEMDSPHGRLATGVLLVQDAAVVPLVLLVGVVALGTSPDAAAGVLLRMSAGAVLLAAGLWLVFHVVAPRLLGSVVLQRNRELPLVLAVVSGLGSAIAAHEVGLSPAIGAFLAGMLLADSPFATQVRADVGAVRTVLMALFFGSIGMLGAPAWIGANLPLVAACVVVVVMAKVLLAAIALRVTGAPAAQAAAAGLCVAQIGEFSFVLAQTARGSVLDDEGFQLVISVTIATLALTPYLVGLAPRLATVVRRGGTAARADSAAHPAEGHVLVIGWGPTGQAVGRRLRDEGFPVHVIDLNVRLAESARGEGFTAHVGDASHPDVLEHAAVERALAVAVTLPDPRAARSTVEQVRAQAPCARVFARARYNLYHRDLELAGAQVVIDEEAQVGRALAASLAESLDAMRPERPAGRA